MRYWVALCLLMSPLAAAAQGAAPAPKSIQDCERIKVDLAYNQCLASFGPAAHTRPGVVAPGQDPEVATPANPRRFGRLAKRKGRVAARGRQKAAFAVKGGRKKASFAVKGGRKQGRRSGRKRR